MNSGDLCVCSWITLCLSKLPLTWGFVFAKVWLVPGSARQPGPSDRVVRREPPGFRRAETGSVHEVEAAPGGARSHCSAATSVRVTGCGERRGDGAARHGGTPTAPEGRRPDGATAIGTGNRVSVNGVRAAGRATGSGSGPRAGQPDLGSAPETAVGQPTGPSRSGHRRRATGGGADRQRSRATGGPGHNGHRPPRLAARRAMCRSSGRLTPEDRPVVDRPTFRGAPGGCAGAIRQHRPGLFTVLPARCARGRPPGRSRPPVAEPR